MSSSLKIIASALLVAVAAAGDCDGLDTGRFCVAGNSTAFVYCPQDIELVCGATTFCKQTQDADISCNVPKYCPSLATEAGSYCMEDDETSFYTCPESPIVGQEATKCGKGLKCHQKTATTTECIPADTCADKKGGYFCSYEDPNKYYSCPGFATQACPRGLVCTAPSAGQIACDYPKSEVQQVGGAATAKDCNDGSFVVNWTDVTVSPTVVKNQKATLTASGILNKPITSGKYTVDVKYAGTSLYSHTGDVCVDESVSLPLNVGTIQLHGMGCPANPGPVSYGLDVTLPSIAPSGKYVITITSKDQDSGNLFCVETDLTL